MPSVSDARKRATSFNVISIFVCECWQVPSPWPQPIKGNEMADYILYFNQKNIIVTGVSPTKPEVFHVKNPIIFLSAHIYILRYQQYTPRDRF
jgi:hypothetical protein